MFSSSVPRPMPFHKSTRIDYVSGSVVPGKISYELVLKKRLERLIKSRRDDELSVSISGVSSRYTSSYRDTMNAQRRKQHIQSVLDMMGRRHKRRKPHRRQNGYDKVHFTSTETVGSRTNASQTYLERGRRLAIPDNKMRSTYRDMMEQVDAATSNTNNNNKVTTTQHKKFFSRVTLIILLLRLAKTYIFSESDRKLLNLYTAMDAAQTADSYKIQNDLVFDITRFKASKKRRVSRETRRVLNLPTEERTDTDIYHVQVELQRLKPLGRFPIEMQKRLIAKACFEAYDQHRVLIRFGRRPWSFYVILSGSAVILEGDPSDIGREVIAINPGATFGERAITDRCHHKVTVISKERIELMCLSAEDYVDIFLAAGMTTCNNDDSRQMSSRLCDSVSGHRRKSNCEAVNRPQQRKSVVSLTNQLVSFLRPKAIIVEDSRTSEWIYLIRSGSCAVMKALQHNVGQVEEPVIIHPKNQVKHKLRRQDHPFGYHENVIKQRNKAFFRNRAELLKGKWIRPAERPTHLIKVRVRDETQVKYESNRDMIVDEDNTKETCDKDSKCAVKGDSGSIERMRQIKDQKTDTEMHNNQADTVINFKKEPFYIFKTSSDNYQERKTVAQNVDEKPQKAKHVRTKESDSTDSNVSRFPKNTTSYVKIDTLEKGNVFGVLELAFGEQPKLSLVSNGAECVLISKKFFTQHCNDKTVKDITDHMRPYPNDDTSRRDVQEKLNWRKKRDLTMQEVVENFKRNIRLRTQIRP